MATQPGPPPDRIDPRSPPERPAQTPIPERPHPARPEITPEQPDIDQPGRGPDEMPAISPSPD